MWLANWSQWPSNPNPIRSRKIKMKTTSHTQTKYSQDSPYNFLLINYDDSHCLCHHQIRTRIRIRDCKRVRTRDEKVRTELRGPKLLKFLRWLINNKWEKRGNEIMLVVIMLEGFHSPNIAVDTKFSRFLLSTPLRAPEEDRYEDLKHNVDDIKLMIQLGLTLFEENSPSFITWPFNLLILFPKAKFLWSQWLFKFEFY